MKMYYKILSLVLALFVCVFSFASCRTPKKEEQSNSLYVRVGDNELSKEYIGYFFYVAQRNMIQEAGMVVGEGGNSTEADVAEFWETTEIEGKKAVEVARDLAVDNAVTQTVQYLKALEYGIVLSPEDESLITHQIENAIHTSGGEEAFEKRLSEMGCSLEAYKQILTENMCVKMLYQKFDSEGKLDITPEELEAYTADNAGKIAPEEMLSAAKADKFNAMSREWEKEFDIIISDENIKEFQVK